ncbi:MAG: hypothetical protein AABZ80_07795 [Gemmatimonadota bacterium]
MLDDLNSDLPVPGRHESRTPASRGKKEREVHPVVEREIPLGTKSERSLDSSVHAWLDGELPEAAVRVGNTAKDVEFWRNLSRNMDRSRLVRTPEHVEAQIMAALPHHAPQMITPWFRREFVVTPMAAVSAGAALMAVAAAITVAILAP